MLHPYLATGGLSWSRDPTTPSDRAGEVEYGDAETAAVATNSYSMRRFSNQNSACACVCDGNMRGSSHTFHVCHQQDDVFVQFSFGPCSASFVFFACYPSLQRFRVTSPSSVLTSSVWQLAAPDNANFPEISRPARESILPFLPYLFGYNNTICQTGRAERRPAHKGNSQKRPERSGT